MHASYHGDKQKVRKLLSEDEVDVTIEDYFGRNAFSLARLNGQYQTIANFLNKNAFGIADLNKKDNSGNTLLMDLCNIGDEIMVKNLLEFQFDVNVKNNNGDTALHLAVKNDHDSIVAILIREGEKLGIDLNESDNEKNSPLATALISKKVNVIQAFLYQNF